MTAQVNIRYSIPDEEWTRVRQLRWDANTFPLFHCFFGKVSFRIGGREVLGSGLFDMSVADLAVGLAELLENLGTLTVGDLKFQQSDDMLEIVFQIREQDVTVIHNLSPSDTWTCTRSELNDAICDFVGHFTKEAMTRVPALFEWRDMGILRAFVLN